MASQNTAIPIVADVVYEQLKGKIFKKELLRGQRLPEAATARQLGVSRTPVREALRRLESEGLVQVVPGLGACLASPSRQEIIDTCEMREILEVEAIRRASQRITPLQLYMLQERIDSERRLFDVKDLETYLQNNDSFHIIIAEASGNCMLAEYIKNILSRSVVQMILSEQPLNFDTDTGPDEHVAILEALKSRDAERCAACMREHLRCSKEWLETK